MKISRILLGLLLVSQLACTGCWCWHRRCCDRYSHTHGGAMPVGCNECSSYGGPQMFGQPVHGSAMLQAPGQPIDERLGTPAKQKAYEGPAKQ